MKTILIKDKPYVPVSERLKHFLAEDEYKDWTIETKLRKITEDWVVMESWIFDKDGNLQSNAFASERREGNVNKTSYVENCHTSCVGRALGMLGIGIDAEIASAEEMAIARDADMEQITQIEKLLISCSLDEKAREVVETEIPELTFIRAERCIAYLSANQKSKIEAGENYNQGDINNEMDDRLARDKD